MPPLTWISVTHWLAWWCQLLWPRTRLWRRRSLLTKSWLKTASLTWRRSLPLKRRNFLTSCWSTTKTRGTWSKPFVSSVARRSSTPLSLSETTAATSWRNWSSAPRRKRTTKLNARNLSRKKKTLIDCANSCRKTRRSVCVIWSSKLLWTNSNLRTSITPLQNTTTKS